MKLDEYFHLTYCSNIHPGESWTDVSAALGHALPKIRHALALTGPMAVGLRLSAEAATALDGEATFDAFRALLEHGDYYVPTINGFPYGAFHDTRVKERVYLPDWRDPARLDYSNRLARLLARLLPPGAALEGSVSTVPGAFRAAAPDPADLRAIASALLQHAAFLAELRARTGSTVTLALEPEPACVLETVADVVAFFEGYLFDARAVADAAARASFPLTVDDVRLHLGVCLDACHMAVEFEDPAEAVRRLVGAGVRILKVQLSSALRLFGDGDTALQVLQPFADDTYLHQVVQRGASGLVRYTDLPEALAEGAADRREWRVHFHVPIFHARMTGFETTQPYLASVLDVISQARVCPMLEVETYTWSVLPAEYRGEDMCSAIARELQWVRTRLHR